jgi:hypothetical protein
VPVSPCLSVAIRLCLAAGNLAFPWARSAEYMRLIRNMRLLDSVGPSEADDAPLHRKRFNGR